MTLRQEQTRRAAAVSMVLLGITSCLQPSLGRATSYASPGPEESYNAPPKQIGLQEYPAHLQALHSIITNCEQSMSAASCDWKLVGPDADVQTAVGIRRVEFAWLRSALHQASVATAMLADSKNPSEKNNALKAASANLHDAEMRLDKEMSRQQEGPKAARNFAPERAALKTILASGGYAQEVPPTLFERLRDEFLNWLNRRLNAIGVSEGSQLIVDLLLISLIIVACGAMIWWFARKVHNQSLMLSTLHTPNASAPSSQDWQKWLDQGKRLAAEQQWREAIHHVYWSAISCLESRGLWPADRARTPREYLHLLTSRPETRVDLNTLTRTFERTWYGDQAVGQPEFDQACALLERLAR